MTLKGFGSINFVNQILLALILNFLCPLQKLSSRTATLRIIEKKKKRKCLPLCYILTHKAAILELIVVTLAHSSNEGKASSRNISRGVKSKLGRILVLLFLSLNALAQSEFSLK